MVPAFLPVGLLLLIIAPLISYYLYKPGVTHSSEVAAGRIPRWGNGQADAQGIHPDRPVLLSLCLWVFGGKMLDATAVCLLAVSLMLALHVVSWKEITKYSSAGTRWLTGDAGGDGQRPDALRLYRLVRPDHEHPRTASRRT